MTTSPLSDTDRYAIRFLREQTRTLLTPHYDTDFNLLRWAQGYYFNLDEALFELTRHLKLRKFYNLDDIDNELTEDKTLKQYFPLGLVGKTGKGNRLLVVECAGRIDLQGILRSVQLNVFLTQRLKFQEVMLNEINRMERLNKTQSSSVYILDLEGLKLDSKLLTIVTGPYRILWTLVYTNYPEWIDTMFVVNAPTFISILWKAIRPFLPERTASKVRIPASQAEFMSEIEEFCDLKCLPKHWGGSLVDKNGDPMCRDRLIIPTGLIPKHMYWQASTNAPKHTELSSFHLGPGASKIATFKVAPSTGQIFLFLNRFAERTYSMAIYHCEKEDSVGSPLEEMHDWSPVFDYPGMPTVDMVKVPIPAPGIFKFRFGNDHAWIRSVTVYYRVRFVTENDEDVCFEEIHS